ncbi:MAG: 3-phosphoshikimate 1-carboxyvinyltransferase [Chromatiales bacterium]
MGFPGSRIDAVSRLYSTFEVQPGGRLRGSLRVPGDKSISHRAIMLGAIAEGRTEIEGFLEGEDTLATLAAFGEMGVHIERDGDTIVIEGAGRDGLSTPGKPLDLGNSGTSMRLLTGLLAGQRFDAVLTGDASLSRRPMRRVIEPLARMGARIDSTAAGTAPLHIHGNQKLAAIDFAMPIASAQVKSSVLLAGLYASGCTCVTEPATSRDHTERMLAAFGCPVQRDGIRVCIDGGTRLKSCRIAVPADLSSAAFFLVGACIAPDSEVTLQGVGVNPTRTGVVDILRAMGAHIEVSKERMHGGEPVADITARTSRLRGVRIAERFVPLAIDEFPAIFIAAACAEGDTVLTGAEELRVKESDRIAVMAENLQRLGVEATPTPDGITIRGGQLRGGNIDSHGDHRVAMAFAMAAPRSRGPLTITDCANVATSFPGFVDLARSAGLLIAGR